MHAPTPHVLLTRFNIPANRVERSIYSAAWLAERMELFETYTVPSVRRQQREGLSWIIYLAETTPPWLRERVAVLQTELPLHPFYLDDPLDPATIREHVSQVCGRTSGMVVTSNLDNDDGLAMDYVARVRSLVPAHQPAAIYLTRGLILHGDRVYLRKDRSNAFGAVADDVASPSFRSCWATVHHQLDDLLPTTVREDGPPAWLQVVHGRNVSNRVGGRLTSPHLHSALFPGLLDEVPVPTLSVRGRSALAQPARVARDRVLRPGAAVVRGVVGPDRYESIKVAVQHRGR